MKKIFICLQHLHPLSILVLRCGTGISFLMLCMTFLLVYIQDSVSLLNTTLFVCSQVYPLLALMVLSITITGALLIDIYDKTHPN